jgi:NADH-quinone oxidoreductase subunit E
VGDSGMMEHCFLLSRRGEHKVLRVRKKMMGGGGRGRGDRRLMSVRRLSPDQPDSFAFTPRRRRMSTSGWASSPPRKRSAVIPILWLVQKQEGWVSEPAMRVVGDLLDLAYIRVLEVATFYTMFRAGPVGRTLIQVCGTTPCRLRGALR